MIIHMTTVHPRDDSRILHKQIRTMAEVFDEKVMLFVQDGEGSVTDLKNDCEIIDTCKRLPRLKRMTVGALKMLKAVISARPKLVIFHDPELIPWATILRLYGIRVIYDVHENYPGQVKRSTRLPKVLRPMLSICIWIVERVFSRVFNGIICVDKNIAKPFPKHKTVVVRNFPILDELFSPSALKMHDRPKHFSYIGTISEDRNLLRMMDSVHGLNDTEIKLRLAGGFVQPGLEELAKKSTSWDSVIYENWLDRNGVRNLLSETRAGLLLIKPIAHEMVGMPIKMCEYMAAGIPIIASNFPFWKEIIETEGAGLVVNPLDTTEIRSAMRWILDNPEEAAAMGQRGRHAVLTKYNWASEGKELCSLVEKHL